METNLVFRKYNDKDFGQYKELYKKVYSKEIDSNFFDRKHYNNKKLLSGPIIYLAINHDGQIVGANSFFVSMLKYKDKENLILQSGDTMVSSEYRGQGIFKRILIFALKDLKNEGFTAIYGFANDKSYPGFVKQGFESVFEVKNYYKILNYQNVIAKKLNIRFVKSFFRFIDVFISTFSCSSKHYAISHFDIDENSIMLFMRECTQNRVHIKKDMDYFNWKYENNPTGSYEKISITKNDKSIALFFIRVSEAKDMKSCEIVDYYIKENRDINMSLKLLSKYYRSRKFDFISIKDNGDDQMINVCVKNLFLKRDIKIYFIRKFLNEFAEIDTLKWHVVTGDYDTI